MTVNFVHDTTAQLSWCAKIAVISMMTSMMVHFFPLDLWKLRIKMDQWHGFLCVVASLVLQRMPWKTETRVTHSVLIYWGRDKMADILLTIFSLFSLFFLHENLYFDSNFSEVCSLGSDTCASHVWRLTEAIHVNQWCLSLLTRASFSLSGYTTQNNRSQKFVTYSMHIVDWCDPRSHTVWLKKPKKTA